MQRLVLVSLAAVVMLATASTAALAQAGRPAAPPPPPPPPASSAGPQSGTVPVARIAYIHLQDVLRRTPGYVVAESTYRKLVTGYQNELQRLQQQLDSAVQAFDQQSIALSPAARQAKQKDLQGMQQRLVQRQQALQDTAQAKEDELMEPLRSRINSIIQGIRAENNYSLIIDADAGGGFLLAADPAIDITPRVLARLTQAQ